MQREIVGVVGLGLLGRGIAACLLGHGFEVIGYARDDAEHAVARAAIDKAMHELVELAGFDPAIRLTWADRYHPTKTWEPLAKCTFVVESVLESLEVKETVFDAIEAVVSPTIPIASNTSALPISQLQSRRKHPQRFLGMHWAEPAHATRFLELIRGKQTTDEPLAAALSLGRRVGKDPCIVEQDIPGFIVNRIGYAMYREALHLLETGVADAETIDRAFRNACGLWATMCGPFRWIDITGGPAVYARAMQHVLPDLSNATEVPPTLQQLADAGARGMIDGRGFYQYGPGDAHAWEDLLRRHAWTVFKLQNEYFPIEEKSQPSAPAAKPGSDASVAH